MSEDFVEDVEYGQTTPAGGVVHFGGRVSVPKAKIRAEGVVTMPTKDSLLELFKAPKDVEVTMTIEEVLLRSLCSYARKIIQRDPMPEGWEKLLSDMNAVKKAIEVDIATATKRR